MYIRVFLAVVEGVCDDLFAVAIREEIDRAGGDSADKCGAETFEEGAWRFVLVDVSVKVRVNTLIKEYACGLDVLDDVSGLHKVIK